MRENKITGFARWTVLAVLFCACGGSDQTAQPAPTKPKAAIGKPTPKQSPERAAMARTLFEETVAKFHLPSADATGARRAELLATAARRYEQLLRDYADQPHWCVQALRSLAGIHGEQGDTDAALRHYDRVAADYPRHDFEVLQAWKAAADLLWDAGRKNLARVKYQKIINRFDKRDAWQVIRTVVKTAKRRLG